MRRPQSPIPQARQPRSSKCWAAAVAGALALLLSTGAVMASLGLVATASAPSPEYPELNSPCAVFFTALVTGGTPQSENPAAEQWQWHIQTVLCSTDGGQSWHTVFSAGATAPTAAAGPGFTLGIANSSSQNCTLNCSFTEPAEWDITLTVVLSISDGSAAAMPRPRYNGSRYARADIRRRVPRPGNGAWEKLHGEAKRGDDA